MPDGGAFNLTDNTVLDCILTLGKEIIATGDAANIDYFTKALISLGFNYPGKLSLNTDWQILIDSNHVKIFGCGWS